MIPQKNIDINGKNTWRKWTKTEYPERNGSIEQEEEVQLKGNAKDGKIRIKGQELTPEEPAVMQQRYNKLTSENESSFSGEAELTDVNPAQSGNNGGPTRKKRKRHTAAEPKAAQTTPAKTDDDTSAPKPTRTIPTRAAINNPLADLQK
ncbi:hypothetical protein FQA39_LY15651 [Lamprigera yunnana]|nr:hypothetical protein FQA39_LY15651 [Lamprigera yunnana]